MRRRFTAALLLSSLLASATPLHAEVPVSESEERAAQLFADGEAAFERGEYRRAGAAFELAYAAKRHFAVLWNAALSWERAGESVPAANDLEQYLRDATESAPYRERASRLLVEISRRLGRVEVHAAGVTDVAIDGVPRSRPTVYVAPGDHVGTASAGDGHPLRRSFSVGAGETFSLGFAAVEPEQRARREEPASSGRLPSWVVIGGGALVVGAGAFTFFSGLDAVDKARAFDREPTQARIDDGYSAQTRTNVLLGVTAGLAVVTAIAAIFFVDWSGPPKEVR